MSEEALNENLLRHLKISPQLLEIISDDPEALAKVHRIQRALLSEKATRKCLSDPNATPQQIAAVIEALRKAEGSQNNHGAGNGNGCSDDEPVAEQAGSSWG